MRLGGRIARTLVRRTALPIGVSVALLAASPGSAEAAHSVERRFSQMINDTRTTTTLSSLDLSERLTRIARRHSRQMAAQGDLYHSDLQGLLGRGISTVGENVGSGNSLEELLAAFMASPPHAHNILGDFDRTGVGVVRVDGVYWLTELFAS